MTKRRPYAERKAWVPMAPLERVLGQYYSVNSKNIPYEGPYRSEDLANWGSCSRKAIERYRRQGRIPLDVADRIACSQGFHPMALWPDEYQAWLDGSL